MISMCFFLVDLQTSVSATEQAVIDSLLSMRLVLPIALHYSLYNKKKHIFTRIKPID